VLGDVSSLPVCVRVLSDAVHGYVIQNARVSICEVPACPAAVALESHDRHSRDIAAEFTPTLTFPTVSDLRRALLSDYSAAQGAVRIDALRGAAPIGAAFLRRLPVPAVGGFGLFTAIDLPSDFLIGEYCGLFCMDGTGMAAAHDSYCAAYPALDSLSGRHVGISARLVGSFTRLINHAAEAAANTRFQARLSPVWKGGGGGSARAPQRADPHPLPSLPARQVLAVPGCDLPRVGCVTVRAVAAGEQLLANYGREYWRAAGTAAAPLTAGGSSE
jgi:hypothetical protein